MRTILRRIMALTLIAALLFIYNPSGLQAAQAASGGKPVGYLISDASQVNIRAGTGTGYEVVGSVSGTGTRVAFYAQLKAGDVIWYYVESNGVYGWVSGDLFHLEGAETNTRSGNTQMTISGAPTVAPTQAATAMPARSTDLVLGYVTNAKSGASLYSGAGSSYRVSATVKEAGAILPYYAQERADNVTWYYVIYGSKKGWVSGDQFATALPTAIPAPEPMGYITSRNGGVAMREKRRSDSSRTGTLDQADAVVAYYDKKGTESVWYYILYGETYGWVCNSGISELTEKPSATTTPAPKSSTDSISGTIRGYVKATETVNMRVRASKESGKVTSIPKGKTLPYYGIDNSGSSVWYYCDYNGTKGWVLGDYLKADQEASTAKASDPATPTAKATPTAVQGYVVSTDKVNIRATADKHADRVGVVSGKGIRMAYDQTQTVNGTVWYHVDCDGTIGWVLGDYLKNEADAQPTSAPTAAASVSGTGTQENALTIKGYVSSRTSKVNMREKASTSAARVAVVRNRGTTLPYYTVKAVDGVKWYQVMYNELYGWICGDYLTETTAGKTASPTASATPKPSDTVTTTPRISTRVMGYVISKHAVNIRSGAGGSYSSLGRTVANVALAYYGTSVESGTTWYYVKSGAVYGWVSGSYYSVTGSAAATATPAGSTPAPAVSPSTSKKLGTGTVSAAVNMRSGPGTSYSVVAKLYSGKAYPYYATNTKGGTVWYYVASGSNYGWVSGDHFTPVKATATPRATATSKPTATPKPTAAPSKEPYEVSDGNYTMTIYPAETIDWWTGGIQKSFYKGMTVKVYDVKSRKIWRAWRWSGGNHADIEPASAEDTAILCRIYGVKNAEAIADGNMWQRRPCLVTIGKHTYACSLYGIPHGTNTIKDNNMDGQICLHFTNSRTHGSNRVDSYHAAAIEYALQHAPNGRKK